MDNEKNKEINANPTKEFFIMMLTRDIDLQPAIAELLDNSLDGAKHVRKISDAMCSVEIRFSKEYFIIKDTCGGISISDAKEYCFRFGRDPEREEKLSNGTGIFGIGMKRALFRMGKSFTIKSKTQDEHFLVRVNVDEWIKDRGTDWTFMFEDLGENEDNDITDCGTEIIVENLYPGIAQSFENPYFRNSFLEYIKRRCSNIVSLNVSVKVNDENIVYADERIFYNKLFKPYVKHITIDSVHIKVIGACAKLGAPRKAGWYVFCNDRMVLYANQGEETGWGTDFMPRFHSSDAAFRGYVMFESSDLEKLPWNTTKTGVDTSSKYYQAALKEMKTVIKTFVSFRNKVEECEGIEPATVFVGNEVSILSTELKDYLQNDQIFFFPELNSENFPAPPIQMAKVSFSVEKLKVDSVKSNLNVRTNKEVGQKCFQYYYDREINTDE